MPPSPEIHCGYRHKLDVLAAHCRSIGRDPADIRKSLVVQAVVGRNQAALDDRLTRLGGSRGVSMEEMRGRAMVGTPEQCVDQLLAYVEAGVDDFIIGARAPVDYETLELVATEIAPLVKDRGAELLTRREGHASA